MTAAPNTTSVSTSSTPLLLVSGVSKRFGATQALTGVDFAVHPGERVAIMGENGAGKSTLMKVIAGVHHPDQGSMQLRGEPFQPANPQEAIRAGVATVYQEPSVFGHLSVLENLWMGRQPTHRGLLARAEMRRQGRGLLQRVELPERLLSSRMGDLSLADQQQVLIARSVSQDAQVLILDEPTSILTATEADRLFNLVDRLTDAGTGVCYITHRFDELERVADRFIVLRDGRNAGETDRPDRDQLLSMMGSTLIAEADAVAHKEIEQHALQVEQPDQHSSAVIDETVPASGEGNLVETAPSPARVVLQVEALTSHGAFENINLTVAAGRICGLYGLVGAGRSEVAMAIFGELPIHEGTITYDGKAYTPRSSRDALRRGIAYLPEDRRTMGLFPHMSVGENLSAAALTRLRSFGLLSPRRESALIKRWTADLAVKTASTDALVTSLSGGNQQKVLLARLVATGPKVLILDEPTRGIDVATKTEIHRRIREIAADGTAVILISSEMAEMMTLADEVTVLHEGKISAHLTGDAMSEQTVLRAAAGLIA